MFWPDPTHQPTHPLTHPPNNTPTYGWRSLHRFQIFKQNWNILISSSAIEFWLIPGVPPGVRGGWMWVGGGERVPPCMRMHTCACTCTHVWHHGEFPEIPPWGRPFAWNYHVYHMWQVHACTCVHARDVHMCGEHPLTMPQAPIHIPPQNCREPKTPKFNKYWTNRDNSILFEDSLPLNIPELI